MSGGAYDQVMGNYNNLVSSSGFTDQEISDMDSKYIDKYHTPTEDLLGGHGMNYDKTIYGDGVFETSINLYRYNGSEWSGSKASSWYTDLSYMTHTSSPFFIRGGHWDYSNAAGVFAFIDFSGYVSMYVSFRPVVMSK